MSNSLELTKSFQERVYERIRDSIGELMSDEDLKKLVEAAVQKAFFEPVIVKDNWDRYQGTKPPWIVDAVKDLLRERVTAAVQAWIKEHPEEVNKAIEDAIAKGMIGLIVSYFEGKVYGPLQIFENELRNKGML